MNGLRFKLMTIATGMAWSAASFMPAQLAQADAADAMALVPDVAHAVITVPNFSLASEGMGEFIDSLGVPVPPEMQNMLASFKDEAGINQGMDDDGTLMVVMPNVLGMVNQFGPPQVLIFVPVTDYQQFIDNYPNDVEGEIATITMDDGTTGFAKPAGPGHALLALDRVLLSMYQPAADGGEAWLDKIGQAGQSAVTDGLVSVAVDIESLAPLLMPFIDMGVGQGKQMMAMQGGDAMAMQMAQLDMAAAGMKGFLRGTRSMVVSLEADGEGIALGKSLNLKPGSSMAELFPGNDKPAASLIDHLPNDEPWVFASSIDFDAIAFGELLSRMERVLPKEAADTIVPNMRELIEMFAPIDSGAYAMYAPNGDALAAGYPLRIAAVFTGDTPQIRETFADYMKSLNGIEVPMGGGPGMEDLTMSYTTSYEANAEEVNGVTADAFTYRMQFTDELATQMGPMLPMLEMFSGYDGLITEHEGRVVSTTTPQASFLSSVMSSNETGDGIGASAEVVATRESRIPANAVMEMYVSPSSIATIVSNFAAMFGAPLPEGAQAQAAPISMHATVESGNVHGQLYVPSEAIRFFIEMGTQFEQAGQGF